MFERPKPEGIEAFMEESEVHTTELQTEEPTLIRRPTVTNLKLPSTTVTSDAAPNTETVRFQDPIAWADFKKEDNSKAPDVGT
jgi:hypothetical protein